MYIRSCGCVIYDAIRKLISLISAIMHHNFHFNNTLQLAFHFRVLAKQQLSQSRCLLLFADARFIFGDCVNRGHNHIIGAEPERGAAAVLSTLKWSQKHAAGLASCPVAPRRCSLRHVCTVSAAAVQNLWSSQRVKCSTDDISRRLFQGSLQWSRCS